MFKAARWRSEKNKIKAVFKFQFQATQIPRAGWEMVMITLVPVDVGRPTVRTEKVAVIDGTCRWANPIYETVKLVHDLKTGRINEKVYHFLVSTTGSTKAEVFGEVAIDLADYAEVFKPTSVSLPLKASNTGAILHVTLQRLQGNGEGSENSDNGDTTVRQQRRTLQSQLSKCDDDEVTKAIDGTNGINSVEDTSLINSQSQVKFSSSRNLPLHDDSNGNLTKSHSFDAISASGSDTSSVYTPKENGLKHNNIHQDSPGLLSLLSNSDAQKLMTSSGYWSGTSAPDESTDGSTNSSGEAGLRERLQDSDETLEKLRSDIVSLTRKVELSELELQTLRKQVVKESRRGQDLSREISSLKEERDALKREHEELKLSKKRTNDDNNFTSKLQPDEEDPCSLLEEIKQELNHEKNLNANLHLQLQKTQEANSELLLAVRDLDELLEQKNREISSSKCSKVDIKEEIHGHFQELEFGNRLLHQQNSEHRQGLLKTTPGHDGEEQYALDVLVKEGDDMKLAFSLEKKIIDLDSEVELYKKDREELEMQMEQLALDYEILKQENHDISSKLEQSQLREQLRMQYECSAHLAAISDLEAHVESLEKELQSQADLFEADIATLTEAKVEQEKRAITAEEALRKTRWNSASTAERLQEEFKRLSEQMTSTFHANEKLVMQTLKEASELSLQKSKVEELLEKSNEELASVKSQYHVKIQQLLNLIDFKSKETDRLLLELKDKCEELENQKKSDAARIKASSEETLLLKAEIEKLKREKNLLIEQIEQKEKLVAEMDLLKTSTKVNEKLLQDKDLEQDLLAREITSMKEVVNKQLAELNELRYTKNEKEKIIRVLNSEMETLKVQIDDLKVSLSEDLLEKENLRKRASDLRSDLQKTEDMITSVERKPEDSNVAKNANGNLSNKQAGDTPEDGKVILTSFESFDMAQVQKGKHSHKNFKFVSTNDVKKSEDFDWCRRMGDKACIQDIHGARKEPVLSNNGANSGKEEGSIVPCAWDQHNIAEKLSEMDVLKKRNESMEAELKDMQERYSEISLKFAEVEGERQQLVKTIRTLKNALKN
uniref:Trichohyalin n=1 Tax=Elaeis guineensis var. tenera TaxID=51953 RepID=A0A6J0PB30_ELAGV|nr:trichohyalin [Elaeis guineensis]XP_019701830.1 trichohyalin [Elaeis guineensis]XP_019701831.1 trichohyalin [Elaeis guineensis]XP_029116835.1 trichohyalin [Elaeis guineensis]